MDHQEYVWQKLEIVPFGTIGVKQIVEGKVKHKKTELANPVSGEIISRLIIKSLVLLFLN